MVIDSDGLPAARLVAVSAEGLEPGRPTVANPVRMGLKSMGYGAVVKPVPLWSVYAGYSG